MAPPKNAVKHRETLENLLFRAPCFGSNTRNPGKGN